MRKIFLFTLLFLFTLVLANKAEALSIPCNRNGNILSVSPNVITPGDRVTIIGNGFGKRINESSGWILARLVMDSDNALGDKRIVVPDTLILSWSDSQIIFTAPDFSLFRELFELEDPQRASKNPTGIISISFDSLAGGGYLCASPLNNATFLLATKCTADLFGDFGEWSSCSENGFQTRQRKILADCPNISTEVPVETRVCTPTCTSWAYSNWSSCSSQGVQSRTIISSLPNGCVGGNPVLTQSCIYTPPSCASWTYSGWSSCSASGQQTRTIISSSPSGCTGGSPVTTQSCAYTAPTCTSWTYSNWGACSSIGQQARTVASSSPSGCSGGNPVLSQNCNYISIPTPKITSISPNPAYEGDKITISGENFEDCAPDVKTDSKILIGGVEKYFWTGDSKWGNKQITYTTNFGQGSGKLKIINCDKLSSNEVDLVVTKRNPVLISLEPNKVYETFGYSTGPWQYITVYGTDFGNTDPGSNYQFYLNGQGLDRDNISSWTNNSFKLHVPYYLGKYDVYWGGEIKVTPGDYELQIRLGKINNTWVYSNKITLTVLASCTQDKWSCGEYGDCLANGKKTRTCTKTFDCPTIETVSPATTQSCAYTPACTADTWQCGSWGACSPQGIQTRSCTRTYDCPSAETAAPAVSQYCEAPNQPKQQSPTEDLGIVNQGSIIKSTVKLLCPVSSTMASQGSGTVIDSKGTILTNKHVINGTPGCLVGFIDNYSDEPYFGNRQIADIYKISSDADIAVLKLRNPSNKSIISIDITKGNSSNLRLGDQITTYGYPAKFGTKITYTSGDFSGDDGNYFKTTAIIDKGNSGGGAYLKNGTFIGIPSEVTPGYFNIMGKILSINKINSWLNNSPIAYNSGSSNSYSRVSILEDIDLNTLDSLGLFVAGDEANIKTETESQKVIAEEKKLMIKIDNNLSKRMNGNILLQVEQNGEGWYVYPDDKKKYYLGRPADAFNIMRNLGLGIKHSELTGYINAKFPSRLSGKILIDVNQMGEAWYISPKDKKAYFLGNPSQAFSVMRILGLGITNADIRKIGVGEIK